MVIFPLFAKGLILHAKWLMANAMPSFQSLEYQLQQSQKLSEMYREQVIQLEDELSRIREEGDVTREIFKVSSNIIDRIVSSYLIDNHVSLMG